MPRDTEHALTFMDHHQKMYQCLPINSVNSNFPRYLYSLDIESKVPGLIEDLANCTCCARHQVNRPTTLTDSKDQVDSVNPFVSPWPPVMDNRSERNSGEEQCECRCRSYSRHLCRAYCEE